MEEPAQTQRPVQLHWRILQLRMQAMARVMVDRMFCPSSLALLVSLLGMCICPTRLVMQCNTMSYHAIPCNTTQHQAMHGLALLPAWCDCCTYAIEPTNTPLPHGLLAEHSLCKHLTQRCNVVVFGLPVAGLLCCVGLVAGLAKVVFAWL